MVFSHPSYFKDVDLSRRDASSMHCPGPEIWEHYHQLPPSHTSPESKHYSAVASLYRFVRPKEVYVQYIHCMMCKLMWMLKLLGLLRHSRLHYSLHIRMCLAMFSAFVSLHLCMPTHRISCKTKCPQFMISPVHHHMSQRSHG